MRLWSLHPKYLDAKGLVAAWREALLAKHVLEGKTLGYRNHPQLLRFKTSKNPLVSINTFLYFLNKEAIVRGYHFTESKLDHALVDTSLKITVTKGQVDYEFNFLKVKLLHRDTDKLSELQNVDCFELNGIFTQIEGGIEAFEKISRV